MVVEKLKKADKSRKFPLFYNGTLEDKIARLDELHKKVLEYEADKYGNPSDFLLEERAEMEMEIDRHLTNGEKLDDPVFDYCMRHFTGSNSNVNFKKTFTTVYDSLSDVENFVEYVGKNIGVKIFSTYDNFPNEFGVISGPAEFSVENSFRYLHVPVEKLSKWENNSWNIQEGDGVYVNPDIFSYPKHGLIMSTFKVIGRLTSFSSGDRCWETDHSNERYIGGSGPKETGLYIGNCIVDKQLGKKREVVVPARKEKVVVSKPY